MRVLLLSCEHGGNRVPARYASLFAGARTLVASHRGWDPGSLRLARRLSAHFGAPLHGATVTRLLVDLNRSLHHPSVFSDRVSHLPPAERDRLVARHYRPHREGIEARVAEAVASRATVIHVAVHTFVPVLDGIARRCDVGLLYDPARRAERIFCARWREALLREAPELRVRRNYPYRGSADGLTTHLRRRFARGYVGLELEVNQRLLEPRSASERLVSRAVCLSLAHTLGAFSATTRWTRRRPGRARIESDRSSC